VVVAFIFEWRGDGVVYLGVFLLLLFPALGDGWVLSGDLLFWVHGGYVLRVFYHVGLFGVLLEFGFCEAYLFGDQD